MIVFCHLLNDRSGSPTVLHSTIEALDAQRNGGVLYVGSHSRGVLEDTGVAARRYWYRRSRYRPVTLLTYLASQIALYRSLSRARDIPKDAIIFVNTLLPFGAMLWGKRTGRSVIVHIHEVSISPAPLRGFLTRCAARCAARLIYVSSDHRRRLPIPGPPAEVIPNPISKTIAARATDYCPRRSGRFEILMLASPRGYKGITEFMSLASSLVHRLDICFTLVLNATPKEVRALTAGCPHAVNVVVHSQTDDPASFYEQADLVLNLARVDQWIETFGLTLVEAMTFGIPVIAPPIGGPTEIVTHGREGFCIDSRDTEALQKAVLSVADDPEQALMMSRAALHRAKDFTFAAYARRLRLAVSQIGLARAPK